jgi:hypothetical protein
MHCAGGQGVGYFDKDPLVNNGNAALRKNEGVEVSEDNVSVLSTACDAALIAHHTQQSSSACLLELVPNAHTMYTALCDPAALSGCSVA